MEYQKETFQRFLGTGTELTISYKHDGSIDHDAIAHMVGWQAEHNVHYIFVNGISSECYMMTPQEQISLVTTMCRATKKNGMRAMCNLMIPAWRDAVQMVKRYEDAGADAVCITPPYLASYHEQALTEYFQAVIEATKLPVYIYNAPQTGNLLPPSFIAKMANQYPHVRGYKDSTQSVVHLETLMGLVNDPEFDYIAGSDSTIFTTLALGGAGIISFISIAFPQPIIDICDAFFAGQYEKARKAQMFVMKIRDVLRKGGNSAGYKYASELMGCPIRGSRYPDSLLVLPDSLKQEIHTDLAKLGLL